LDQRLAIQGLTDLAVPAREFAALDLPVERVFITENEINGLAFPAVPSSLVIFGLGYGLDRLAEVRWLHDRALHYWGDIDTYGFHILDRLRVLFPDAQSLLMDRETLLAHAPLWVRESNPYDAELPRLTAAEGALYDNLRHNCLGERVRLEQERIPYGWLERVSQQSENVLFGQSRNVLLTGSSLKGGRRTATDEPGRARPAGCPQAGEEESDHAEAGCRGDRHHRAAGATTPAKAAAEGGPGSNP
jgi:hypothetical protein